MSMGQHIRVKHVHVLSVCPCAIRECVVVRLFLHRSLLDLTCVNERNWTQSSPDNN